MHGLLLIVIGVTMWILGSVIWGIKGNKVCVLSDLNNQDMDICTAIPFTVGWFFTIMGVVLMKKDITFIDSFLHKGGFLVLMLACLISSIVMITVVNRDTFVCDDNTVGLAIVPYTPGMTFTITDVPLYVSSGINYYQVIAVGQKPVAAGPPPTTTGGIYLDANNNKYQWIGTLSVGQLHSQLKLCAYVSLGMHGLGFLASLWITWKAYATTPEQMMEELKKAQATFDTMKEDKKLALANDYYGKILKLEEAEFEPYQESDLYLFKDKMEAAIRQQLENKYVKLIADAIRDKKDEIDSTGDTTRLLELLHDHCMMPAQIKSDQFPELIDIELVPSKILTKVLSDLTSAKSNLKEKINRMDKGILATKLDQICGTEYDALLSSSKGKKMVQDYLRSNPKKQEEFKEAYCMDDKSSGLLKGTSLEKVCQDYKKSKSPNPVNRQDEEISGLQRQLADLDKKRKVSLSEGKMEDVEKLDKLEQRLKQEISGSRPAVDPHKAIEAARQAAADHARMKEVPKIEVPEMKEQARVVVSRPEQAQVVVKQEQIPPLEENYNDFWVELKTPEGKIYYGNRHTGRTQWQKPEYTCSPLTSTCAKNFLPIPGQKMFTTMDECRDGCKPVLSKFKKLSRRKNK